MKTLLIVLLFFVVVLFIVLLCIARKDQKARYGGIMGRWSAFILTLFGFFLAIGDDYFSQFDYDIKRIKRDIFSHQDNLNYNYSEVGICHKAKNPQYYFVLDVSKSMLNEKEHPPVPLKDYIKNSIRNINKSGKCPPGGWDFDVKKDDRTITYWRWMQVRLINTILKQYDKHKEDNFNYSVVLFADSPSEIANQKTVNEVLDMVYNAKFEEKYTDFNALLGYLHNEIIRKNISPANKYDPVECHIILFSDYLHDVGYKYDESDEKKEMLDFVKNMREKSVNVKFYYLEGAGKNKGIPVDYMLKTVFPESPIGLLDEKDELICPIISRKPISFFYTNNLFEESLTTHITFDGIGNKKKELCFELGPYGNDVECFEEMKQEYYLIDGTDTLHLSRNCQKITVDLNDRVELMIKGYIPAPYMSPDVIIQDEEEGSRYIIPVTFYMEFPKACSLLLYCIIIVLGFLSVLLGVNLIKEIG